MKTTESFEYDFAISYAGEEEQVAQGIHNAIKEKYSKYSIFLASKEKTRLVGQDGEQFFENLFLKAKQVIVILSENYKRKEWTRYEWDIIRERNKENRCIPIKVDNVKILGLSSNFIYLPFKNNFDEISKTCIEKLLIYEKMMGIDRDTELQAFIKELQNSTGSVDRAAQLVYDDRERTPLGDIEYPEGEFTPTYKIIEKNELAFSKLKRLDVRIDVGDNLSEDEIKFNIKHLTATIFNSTKYDAIKIFVYCSKASNFLGFDKFNVARADFAPYGDWARAEEGFAYNLPVEKFDWSFDFEKSYFDKSVKIETAEEMAERLVQEILINRTKKKKQKS